MNIQEKKKKKKAQPKQQTPNQTPHKKKKKPNTHPTTTTKKQTWNKTKSFKREDVEECSGFTEYTGEGTLCPPQNNAKSGYVL